MANHGQLEIGRTISIEEFNDAIDHIKTDVLKNQFKESREGNAYVLFYISNYDGFPITLRAGYEKGSLKRSVIDIRHGHGLRLMWWIEGKIWEYLYDRFGGQLVDDGIGPYEIKNRTSTYREYVESQGFNPVKRKVINSYEKEMLNSTCFTREFLSHFGAEFMVD